jgi:hypothetical protein
MSQQGSHKSQTTEQGETVVEEAGGGRGSIKPQCWAVQALSESAMQHSIYAICHAGQAHSQPTPQGHLRNITQNPLAAGQCAAVGVDVKGSPKTRLPQEHTALLQAGWG